MATSRNRKRSNKNAPRRVGKAFSSNDTVGTRTPIIPSPSKPAGSSVTITLDGPVTLKGWPAYRSANGKVVTAAVLTGPETMVLTFDAAPTGSISMPFQDPAVRNNVGGYVQSGAYLFPT